MQADQGLVCKLEVCDSSSISVNPMFNMESPVAMTFPQLFEDQHVPLNTNSLLLSMTACTDFDVQLLSEIFADIGSMDTSGMVPGNETLAFVDNHLLNLQSNWTLEEDANCFLDCIPFSI